MAHVRSLITATIAISLLVALVAVGVHQDRAQATTISRCQETQLDVHWASGGVGLGHVAELIVITNISSSTCTVMGYPTVRMTGAANVVAVIAKKTRNGYLGGLGGPNASVPIPVVTLRSHGGAASSMVEGEDNPVGDAVECVYYAKVFVTLPGLSPPYRFTSKFPGCIRPQVHPFVKGTHGTQMK